MFTLLHPRGTGPAWPVPYGSPAEPGTRSPPRGRAARPRAPAAPPLSALSPKPGPRLLSAPQRDAMESKPQGTADASGCCPSPHLLSSHHREPFGRGPTTPVCGQSRTSQMDACGPREKPALACVPLRVNPAPRGTVKDGDSTCWEPCWASPVINEGPVTSHRAARGPSHSTRWGWGQSEMFRVID